MARPLSELRALEAEILAELEALRARIEAWGRLAAPPRPLSRAERRRLSRTCTHLRLVRPEQEAS